MPPAPTSYRDLLRIPQVARLLTATVLSRLAGRMFLLVLVLYALDRFHDPGFAGWLSFAALAPGSPPARCPAPCSTGSAPPAPSCSTWD